QTRPAKYEEVEVSVPPMIRAAKVAEEEKKILERAAEPHHHWHRTWEGLPAFFTVMTAAAVIVASLFEILPTFLIGGNVPTIKTVKPYTPLELYGRDIYLREGCYNCHSQMIRPFIDETVRYGQNGQPAEYSRAGEFIYDHPFQWGSKRTGPDLAREGGKRDELWHLRHLENPRATSPGSVMPSYPHLLTDDIPFDVLQKRVDVMAMLGVPYDAQALAHADTLAHQQALKYATELKTEGGPAGMENKEVIALIAYLQRLGQDIKIAKLSEDPAYPAVSATSACDPSAPPGANSALRAWMDGAEMPAEPKTPEPPVDTARGTELYNRLCATCHGDHGAGDGPTAKQLAHPPANFTEGTYELRTTEHESLPVDADMFRTISRGVHGTAMPPWGTVLSEADRWQLAAHLKTLSKEFAEDTAPPPVAVTPPEETPERIAHGKQLYTSAGCASCHGPNGRGDGPAASALRYKSGAPVTPRDFTGDRFHRSSRLRDIYMTVFTGLDGTPMGSFAKVLQPDELWDVAMYVHSLVPKFVDEPSGLRCPAVHLDPNPDELIGVRTLMRETAGRKE
ncbi:MAG: cytochrome-c oxidase, cbb3-type subunit II, partial [Acidobacteriota bacterium]